MNRFLPAATGPDPKESLIGTVAVQVPSPVDNYQFVVKADHQISDAHRISARYLQGTASFVARFPSQNTLRGFDVDNHFELRNANLSDTYVFSPKTVNELRLAYGRAIAQGSPQNGLDTPRFLISGLVNFGALQSVPASRVFNVFQINDVLSHLRGRHVLRVGADLRKIQDNSVNATNSRGVFTFAIVEPVPARPAEHVDAAFRQHQPRIPHRPVRIFCAGRLEGAADADAERGLALGSAGRAQRRGREHFDPGSAEHGHDRGGGCGTAGQFPAGGKCD